MRGDKNLTDSQVGELVKYREYILNNRRKDETPDQAFMVYEWVKELYWANIPTDYWGLELAKLKVPAEAKLMAEKYITNIQNAVEKGLGMMLLGATGVGKTSLLAEIGKAGIMAGKKVYYTTLETYIDADKKRGEDPFALITYNRVWSSQLLLLDEIDKVYIKAGSSWVVKRFTDLLKGLCPYGKSVVMATNANEEEVKAVFGDAVHSAIMRYNKFVTVEGDDFGRKRQVDWDEALATTGPQLKVNGVLREMAKAYKEAERQRLVAEYGEEGL